MPTLMLQLRHIARITLAVAADFVSPKRCVRLWQMIVFAGFVPMPKTAIYKYDCAILAQHNVGGAGQSFHIFAETHAACKQETAHYTLWPRVAATNVRHAAVPLLGSQHVNAFGQQLGHTYALILLCRAC